MCQDFTDCFNNIKNNFLVYCDPPYVPISDTASFTKYAKTDFNLDQQKMLVNLVNQARNNKISSLVSNHDLAITRQLYKNATEIVSFDVRRAISCKADNRKNVKELLAIYDCKKL